MFEHRNSGKGRKKIIESFSNTHIKVIKGFDLGQKNSKLFHASVPLRNLKIEIRIQKVSLPPQVWAGTTWQKRRQLIRPEGGKAAAAWRSRLLGATTWQKSQPTRDEEGKAAAGLCCLSLVGTTWTKWPLNRHGERKPAQRSVVFLDCLV
jgi:hypothetical protein